MAQLIQWIARIGDKTGSVGAVVSAMGCAMCFPAIASLGAAVGLGFLIQWEGLFINTLLLLSLYPWFKYGWSSNATYTGLGLMVAVSIWDLVSPASRRCDPEHCELPAKQP